MPKQRQLSDLEQNVAHEKDKKVRHLKHSIHEFNLWVRRMGRKRSTLEEFQHQARSLGVKSGDLRDDLAHEATRAANQVAGFVDEIIGDPEPHEAVGKKCAKKADNLAKQVDEVLDMPDISKSLQNALVVLSETLKSVSKKITDFFKGFSNPLEKLPSITPKHNKHKIDVTRAKNGSNSKHEIIKGMKQKYGFENQQHGHLTVAPGGGHRKGN